MLIRFPWHPCPLRQDSSTLNQSKYIIDLLARVSMLGSKPYATSCTLGKNLTKSDGDALPNPIAYRHIVGPLQHSTLTKPNIAYIVNKLCQFLHCPTLDHLQVAKRVLHYLKGTPNHGLHFAPGPLQLYAYYDFYWASDPLDQRSTTGYFVFFRANLVS